MADIEAACAEKGYNVQNTPPCGGAPAAGSVAATSTHNAAGSHHGALGGAHPSKAGIGGSAAALTVEDENEEEEEEEEEEEPSRYYVSRRSGKVRSVEERQKALEKRMKPIRFWVDEITGKVVRAKSHRITGLRYRVDEESGAVMAFRNPCVKEVRFLVDEVTGTVRPADPEQPVFGRYAVDEKTGKVRNLDDGHGVYVDDGLDEESAEDLFLCFRRTMLESFFSMPGRNYRATYTTGQGASRILAEVLPSDFVVHNHDDESIPKRAPLLIKTVDCLVGQNAKVHNTNVYEQTTERVYGTPHLVIRRGQRFNIAITFDRPYRPDRDNITFTFQFGSEVAGISSGSRISVRLSDGIKPNSWSAGLLENNTFEMSVLVQLLTPPNGIVGKATLIVDTERIKKPPQAAKAPVVITSDTSLPSLDESAEDSDDEEEEEDSCEGAKTAPKKRLIVRYTHEQPVYVLFNPWLKEDQVYLADNDQRTQYVVKDFGNIYFGNQYIVSSRPWNYGQYEVGILDIANYLLDRARLRPSSRGNAVNVVRAIAKLVNAPDDNGIVVGNWSGVYVDGTPPTQWTGSAPILNEFFETKSPVKYGQCWVFAGIATTVCRALGIPTRCVTNFASAHDCDGGNKVNVHWNLSGEPINDWNKDNIWCFHVWNEAFMARPDVDLATGGDWQAFDVTPQLTADGVSCAGPCAVKSVKRGDVYQRYDCALLFYEMYTDVMHWNLQADRTWRTIVEKNRTGRRIVTEKPLLTVNPGDVVQKTSSSGSSSFSTLSQGDSSSHAFTLSIVDVDRECLDLTSAYKHSQGCEEERASLQRACAFFTIPPFYDQGDGDVKYEIVQTHAIPIGTEYSIVVRAQNTCRFERTVAMTLTLAVIYYTGLTKSRLRSETFNFNLCSLRSREVVMRVSVEDYSHGISELAMFRVYMHAVVEETEQLTTSFSDFRLILPTLDILTPKVVRVGEPFDCTVQLASPMLISLQHCSWMVEALGMLPGKRYAQPESEPYALSEIKVKMFPSRPGPTTIVASFYSTELTGLTGSAEIVVHGECDDSPTPSEIKLF